MDLKHQFEYECVPLIADVMKIVDSGCNSSQLHESLKQATVWLNANGKRKIEEGNTSKKKRSGRFTVHFIPEKLTHIVSNIFVRPTFVNGKISMHIRQYIRYDKFSYQTRRRVNFEPRYLNVFATNAMREQDLLTLSLELLKNFVATYNDSHFSFKQLSFQGDKKDLYSFNLTSFVQLFTFSIFFYLHFLTE